MALGGTRARMFVLVAGAAVRLALAGIVIGLAGTAIAARLLSTWLRDVNEYHPATIAATSAILLLVAVVASAAPAWRATRVDPVVALREQ
jgi:putative ABC transport system permease protein